MPSRPGDPRNTARYRRLRAVYLMLARASDQPCGLCGKADPPVDQVHHLDPHRMGTRGSLRHQQMAAKSRYLQ
jgi:hypothetical protein